MSFPWKQTHRPETQFGGQIVKEATISTRLTGQWKLLLSVRCWVSSKPQERLSPTAGLLGCLYVTVRVHLQVIVLQCAGFWGVLEPNSEISIAPFPVIQRRHSHGFGSGTNGD